MEIKKYSHVYSPCMYCFEYYNHPLYLNKNWKTKTIIVIKQGYNGAENHLLDWGDAHHLSSGDKNLILCPINASAFLPISYIINYKIFLRTPKCQKCNTISRAFSESLFLPLSCKDPLDSIWGHWIPH